MIPMQKSKYSVLEFWLHRQEEIQAIGICNSIEKEPDVTLPTQSVEK